MSQISISVVVPSYNSAGLVTEALDSVLNQTLAPAQIIVVDDGSADDTRQRLEPYVRRGVAYVFQPNAGPSAARNRGIAQATGDWIAFLDADDVWHPRKLELQTAALIADPDLALLATNSFTWPASVFPGIARSGPVRRIQWTDIAITTAFGTPSVMVRRALLNSLGGFDPQLRGSEDRDLWVRIARQASIGILQSPLVGYRDVPGSLSRQAGFSGDGGLRRLQKLDAENAWEGRWKIRRQAYALHFASSAYNYDVAGKRFRAIAELARSFTWSPFSMPRQRGLVPFCRCRLLCAFVMRMLRLRRMHSGI